MGAWTGLIGSGQGQVAGACECRNKPPVFIKCLFRLYSVSVGGIFLKIHTCDSTPILWKGHKFSHDRLLLKGTLHEDQYTLSAVPRLSFKGFS
jgi:hypothetical protein